VAFVVVKIVREVVWNLTGNPRAVAWLKLDWGVSREMAIELNEAITPIIKSEFHREKICAV
jgi:hypothetical protein